MGVQKTHGPGSTEDAVKAIVQEVSVSLSHLYKREFMEYVVVAVGQSEGRKASKG